MQTFKDILEKYGDEQYIIPSDSLIAELYEINPDFDQRIHNVLFEEQPIVAGRCPKGHEIVAYNRAMPIPSEYIKFIQALLSYKYDKHYTFSQLVAIFNADGIEIKSRGTLTNIFNRLDTVLGLEDKERQQLKDSKKRKEAALAKGHKRHTNHTEKSRKQVEKMNELNRAHNRIRAAEKEKANAKRALAKKLRKSNVSAKEALAARDSNVKEPEARVPKDKKILYQPTPKQALFHEAAENIVLYGGAAGF